MTTPSWRFLACSSSDLRTELPAIYLTRLDRSRCTRMTVKSSLTANRATSELLSGYDQPFRYPAEASEPARRWKTVITDHRSVDRSGRDFERRY